MVQNGTKQDSYRNQLVNSARDFKSNWVTFGELLTQVASEKTYIDWGYKHFEDYCKLEIKIKKNTAIKLTNAYFFITSEDPDIFNHSRMQSGLDLETVSILQKAKNDENCPAEVYDELKEAALEKGQSSPTLARKFRALTKVENEDAIKEFNDQNIKLINRLQQRIGPVDTIPDKFKQYLSEMEAFFDSIEDNDQG